MRDSEPQTACDLHPPFASALCPGRLVTCAGCRHFEARPGAQPDGYCRRYATAAWAAVPFRCAGYRPADPAEAAREEVLERLRADPRITRVFATRWRDDVLIVTLAVRGVGTCELAIPAARLTDPANYARLLTTLGGHA